MMNAWRARSPRVMQGARNERRDGEWGCEGESLLAICVWGRAAVRVDNKFDNYTILSTQVYSTRLGLALPVLPDRLNDAGSTPSRPFSCFLIWWACRLDCHSDSSVNGIGSIKLWLRFLLQLQLKLKVTSSRRFTRFLSP